MICSCPTKAWCSHQYWKIPYQLQSHGDQRALSCTRLLMFFLKFLHTSSNLTVSDSIETNLYNQQPHGGCCKWVERQITIAFRWVNPLCSMVLATSRCQRRWLLWPRCLTMVTCGNWSTQHPESKHWQSEIELVHCEISGELHTLNSTTGRVIWVVQKLLRDINLFFNREMSPCTPISHQITQRAMSEVFDHLDRSA